MYNNVNVTCEKNFTDHYTKLESLPKESVKTTIQWVD